MLGKRIAMLSLLVCLAMTCFMGMTDKASASNHIAINTVYGDDAPRSYSKAELRLMASIICCEAGSESFQGKLAVGIVVMNRVKSKSFPNTVKKVIYQRGQFSPTWNGAMRRRLAQWDAGKNTNSQWKSCISAAKKCLQGQTTIKLNKKTKSMKGVHYFNGVLPGAKFRIGGHKFK